MQMKSNISIGNLEETLSLIRRNKTNKNYFVFDAAVNLFCHFSVLM